MKNKCFVGFDFDSTIACTEHRWHMVTEDFDDWRTYGLACENDTEGPAFPLAKLLSEYEIPWAIISARHADAMKVSRKWLADRGLTPWAIILKPDVEAPNHGQWKADTIRELEKNLGMPCAFYVEDNDKIAAVIEANGIKTQLVHSLHSMNTPIL